MGRIETLAVSSHVGLVVNTYARPTHCRVADFEQLEKVTETAALIGDFNALNKDWGDHRTSPFGKCLLAESLENHLV